MDKINKIEELILKYSELSNRPVELESVENYNGMALGTNKAQSYRHYIAEKTMLKLGEFIKELKKVFKEDTKIIKSIIQYRYPNLEWHHAGFFKNRMGKTYFVSYQQAIDIIKNFNDLKNSFLKYQQNKISKQNILNEILNRSEKFERITDLNTLENRYYYITKIEMKGKYGFFQANDKYNLQQYYSGILFNNQEDYLIYIQNL